jgi:hypothetical protein
MLLHAVTSNILSSFMQRTASGGIVFAVTRIDDVLKVSGAWAKWGVDYKRTLWIPHSGVVFVAWALIGYGFYRMSKAFSV